MKKIVTVVLLILVLAFQGCAAKEESSVVTSDQAQNEEVTATVAPTEVPAATPTVAPTVTIAPAADPTPTAVPEGLVLPVTKNDTGKVTIQTVSKAQDNLYSAIISSIGGENVVVDPYKMPRKKVLNINPVAIANTHLHVDHIDNMFNNDYKQAQLMNIKLGEIQTKDFHIYNIRASHTEDPIVDNISTNYFVVIEVDGLRIAYLGDCGQTELTEDQLKQLGEIDIAFTQFDNPQYSNMSFENGKGFKLVEQLNPRIFIPTHCSEQSFNKMKEKYGEITEVENILTISKEDLPEGTMHPYKILNTHKYQ